MKALTTFSSLALVLTLLFSPGEISMAQLQPKTIKTYMSFGLPIDPANIRTLTDLDLSYALGASLVDWTESRALSPGLAESWDFPSDKEVAFHLRTNAKWSDGAPITADQVIKCLDRAKKVRPELKILFDIVESIKAPDAKTVAFKLKIPVATSGIVKKLTEPMYGLTFVKPDGDLDLTKTAGPFFLKAASDKELTLVVNKHWWGYVPSMADEVVIRQPRSGDAAEGAVFDEWVNLVGSSSISEAAIDKRYGANSYAVWHRQLDRTFFFSASPKLDGATGRSLLKALSQKLSRQTLTKGLSGYRLTPQFFPSGYVLFDPEFQEQKDGTEIPPEFKKKPLEVLIAEGRISETLKKNLAASLQEATGHAPRFISVPLKEFDAARSAGNYDLMATALPVNDPNIEGALSFFFGLTPSIIPNAGSGNLNFKERIEKAQRLENVDTRHREYRQVFTDATHSGCVLPLFHYSTIVVAREGIDLSGVPSTDETVAFAKVQFK